ncbi:MAG: amidohydrolase family protein [Roseburia sp.]|nr:amidohydrolase family protein [Roseburia sp.]MCM1277420.1 amidohydrolase family protein [Robinsoniella sp.]
MPSVFGIPLIGFIQMVIGAAIVAFIVGKYLTRPKKNKRGEWLIQNVHVIVGDGTELKNQNVYIKDGMIKKMTTEPVDRKNVQVIDGTGKTLMPGIIDSHVHIQGLENRSDSDSDRFLAEVVPEIFQDRLFPYGVTTLKELGSPRHFIYKLRDKINAGEIIGPELLVVGPNITGVDGHPASTLGGENSWMRKEMAAEIASAEDAHKVVKELKAAGVDFLKIVYQGGDYWYFDQKLQIGKLDKELMEQIIREGKENGLKTTAHVFYKEDVGDLLKAGIYGIEHGILDEDIEMDDDIVNLWKKSGAYFVPTVNAMTYEKVPGRLQHSIHNLKVLYDAGIPIAMGTDNLLETMSGEIEHKELQYYTEAGLTPMQAIVTATGGSAQYLGILDRKGTVEEGKEADLILLEKNPLEDISYIQFIDKVFLKGRLVHSAVKIQSYEIPGFDYPENSSSLVYGSTDGNEERVLDVKAFLQEKKMSNRIYRSGKLWAAEEYELEANLSAHTWHYTRKEDGTELLAVREGDMIRMTGTFKGKKQDKKLKIGDGLWYQLMDQAMPAFVHSTLDEIIFYSIGTGNNRGAMGLGEFAAKKLGEESITVNDRNYACIKVSFVLTMFSWAWTGIYWYEKETGILIQSGEKKENGNICIQYTIKGEEHVQG